MAQSFCLFRCGGKSKRRCVRRQHYFFDADARLDHAREYGPKNQGAEGCCNYPTVSASIHDFSLVMAERFSGSGPRPSAAEGVSGVSVIWELGKLAPEDNAADACHRASDSQHRGWKVICVDSFGIAAER